MKKLLIPVAMAMAAGMALSPINVQAEGCAKGAVIGGIAGHEVDHHGLIGAGAGCAIGHHEASKHLDRKQVDQKQAQYDSRSHHDNDQ